MVASGPSLQEELFLPASQRSCLYTERRRHRLDHTELGRAQNRPSKPGPILPTHYVQKSHAHIGSISQFFGRETQIAALATHCTSDHMAIGLFCGSGKHVSSSIRRGSPRPETVPTM